MMRTDGMRESKSSDTQKAVLRDGDVSVDLLHSLDFVLGSGKSERSPAIRAARPPRRCGTSGVNILGAWMSWGEWQPHRHGLSHEDPRPSPTGPGPTAFGPCSRAVRSMPVPEPSSAGALLSGFWSDARPGKGLQRPQGILHPGQRRKVARP